VSSRSSDRLSGEDAVVELLGRIANLLAVLVTDGKTQTEAILRLAHAGYAPKEIADFLGTTSNTVRVTLSTKRAAGRSRRRPT